MNEPQIQARYETLENKVRAYHPNPDLSLLRKSFEYAFQAHIEQIRSSGEPYVTHVLGVAEIIADLRLDMNSLCAGLLHDVVEDTDSTLEDITENFNAEVAFLVDGVTKLGKMRFNTSEERQAETIRKMIVAMSRDIRVVLVKLADRLHNMRTLDYLTERKQRRIAQETMDIYAPLANRFGINWIKVELEDTSFRALYREEYYQLAENIAKKRRERQRYIKDVLSVLEKVMKDNDLQAEFQGRPKHFLSIYKKMQAKEITFDQVFDVLAFRIIVDTKSQCYEALGIVHNLWRPIPARFKDYIAMPKPNGYQSLHTAVIGPYRQPCEIQIRTIEMHDVAEEGVAAHWLYKEGKSGPAQAIVTKFTWLRQLIEDFQEVTDHRDFMERLKMDLFSEEVFVFTPRGDIRAFPAGATVIDFAYSIHTEVGDHCHGAKVNGVMVPFNYELKNGDAIEIQTHTNQRPNRQWLDIAKTGRARSKIKHFLRTEARLKAIEIGKELLESELRTHGFQYKTLLKKGKLAEAADSVKLQSVEEMLMKLGYGVLSVRPIIKSVIPDLEEREDKTRSSSAKLEALSRKMRKFFGPRKRGIKVDGVDDDLMVTYARCCNPVPGESIMGFVTRGRGLTVHSSDCAAIASLEPERQIEVRWDEQAVRDEFVTRVVRIEVISKDEKGLLADMSAAFSVCNINIQEAHCRARKDGRAVNTFDLIIGDHTQLETALRRLRQIKGVLTVSRVRI